MATISDYQSYGLVTTNFYLCSDITDYMGANMAHAPLFRGFTTNYYVRRSYFNLYLELLCYLTINNMHSIHFRRDPVNRGYAWSNELEHG